MRVVFMGTPDFAKIALETIIDNGFDVVGVYTQPDRKQGRGHKVLPPPVKKLALEHDIPVFQPKSFRNKEEIEKLKKLNPDVCVVVAYGQILPTGVINIPKYGCINLHGSLLPLYRGAAPIQWSLINGEKITGVTSMYISKGLDEGDIILQEKMSLDDSIDAIELFDKMAPVGAKVVIKTLNLIKNGDVKSIPQNETGIKPTFAPLLNKEMAVIDFSKDATTIHNLIRGLVAWPVANTKFNNKNMKCFKSKVVEKTENWLDNNEQGILVDDTRFVVSCENNTFLELLEVQIAGKKRVSGIDFLNGHQLKIGTKIG